MTFWEAVDYLNDMTEHRFGSGPLGDKDADGEKTRKKAFKIYAKACPDDPALPTVRQALGL